MKNTELETLAAVFLSGPGSVESKKAEKQLLAYRNPGFAETLFHLLTREGNDSNKGALLRICWENGADFSAFSLALIDMVKLAPWPLAIEAFSVMENNRPDTFLPEKKEQDLNHILQGFDKLDDQRKAFTGRLIELYENSNEDPF
jgi:hypothetical protein